MPVAATQHTADGAEAFAEFFVRTIDWGYATTSGAYIRDYALPNCSGCSAYANEFDADRRAGHRYSGGRISTTQVAMAGTPLVRGAEDTALVSFNIESFEELDKKGGFVTADGAHSGARYEVSLKWAADGWRVVQVALEQ